MAKRISSRDLFENEDIFKGVRKSAQDTLKTLEEVSAKMKKSAKDLQSSIGKLKFGNTKEINALLKNLERINQLSKEAKAVEQMRKVSLSAQAKAELELLTVEKARQQAKQEQLRTAKMEAQEEARVTKERERAAKSAQNQASYYKQLEASVRELKNKSKELGAEMLSLEAKGQKNSARYRELAQAYQKVTAAAKQGDAQLKQLDKTVGDNFRNVGNYTQAVSNLGTTLATAFGVTVGLQGFVNLFKELTTTFMSFEFQSAVVASVLDKTTAETKALQENAKYLGATTARTAQETAQLQEAYARLGFSMEEILKMTKATINGSIAMNSNLEETAELTGAVVRSFDQFSASSAPEIQDKMVKATQKSALSFQKLQTAIPIVAGAANSAGISFDRMLALLGKLSDAGIDASSSATSLRNIFIESAGQGLDYNQILEKIAQSSDKLTMGFDNFGKRAAVASNVLADNLKGIDDLESAITNSAGAAERAANNQLNTLQGRVTLLGSAWEGFLLSLEDGNGRMAQVSRYLVDGFSEVLNIFAGTSASIEQMREESAKYYKDQFDNLENLKKSKEENYKATIKQLNADLSEAKTSEQKRLIQQQITIETRRYQEARNGIISQQETLKKDVEIALQQREAAKNFAETLVVILGIVGKLVKGWVLYKTITYSLLAIEKARLVNWSAFGRLMMAQIPMTRAYRLEQLNLARAQAQGAVAANASAVATKRFGAAITSIAWVAIATALIEIATHWYDVASGAAEARRQTEMYRVAEENASRRAEAINATTQAGIDEQLRKLDLEIRKRKAKGEDEKKLEQERAERTTKIITDAKKQYDVTVKGASDEMNALWHLKQRYDKAMKNFDEWNGKRDGFWDWGTEKQDAAREEVKAVMKLAKQYTGYEWESIGVDYNAMAQRGGFDKLEAKYTEQVEYYKKLKDGQKQYNDQLDEANTKLLETTSAQGDFNIKVADNSKLFKNNLKDIKDNTDALKDYKTELAQIEVYLSRQDELLWRIKEINDKRNIESLERQVDAEFDYQVKQLDEFGVFSSQKLNELINQRADAEQKFLEEKDKFEKEQLDKKYTREANERVKAIAQERNELLKEAEVTFSENFELANKDKKREAEAGAKHKKALEEIEYNYSVALERLDAEEEKRYADLQSEKVAVTDQTQRDIAEINRKRAEDITKFETDLNKDWESKQDKLKDDELKKIAAREKAKQDLFKLTADYLIKQSERIVEQLEKEIAAAEKQADTLRALAEEGNINAKESLAEQQKIIAEKTRQKEQELRRQQQIRLAETVYTTYSSKVEAGSKNPLAETIRDTTLLQAFINSLPTYESGTEDTGKDGRGVDGKGGMLSVLHPNERVIPKDMNEKIGSMSNEQLTKIAQEYNVRKTLRYNQDSSLDFALLINEVKDLKKEIRNKPVSNIELGQITQSAMEIVQSSKKGNSIVYNRFKVRK